MKSSRSFGFALALALSLSPLAASAKLGGASSPSVSFTAKGPAGFKIVGTTSDLKVSDDGTNVVVTVRLDTIATGLSLRDKHTKEALEAEKYPTAELTVARSALKFPDGSSAEADGTGTLKLHGTSKALTFHYTVKKDGSTLAVSATANINFNDFGITAPSYAGITVKPDVSLSIGFKTTDN